MFEALELLLLIASSACDVGGLVGNATKRSPASLDTAFWDDLSREQVRAVLEVIAAAALHDGQLDEGERKLLEPPDGASAEGAALVESTLAGVREALPPSCGHDAYRTFLADRSEALASDDRRARVFDVAARVLLSGSAPDRITTTRLFGEALQVPEERVMEAMKASS